MSLFELLAKWISLIAREMSSRANPHSHSVDVATRKISRSATALTAKQVLKPLVCSR